VEGGGRGVIQSNILEFSTKMKIRKNVSLARRCPGRALNQGPPTAGCNTEGPEGDTKGQFVCGRQRAEQGKAAQPT
jgi:hypothetical protein